MADSPEKPRPDVVLLGPPTADGGGVHVLRAREDRVEAGEMRPLKDGVPIGATTEVVKLSPRADAPNVCDVEVKVPAAARPEHHEPVRGKGPARVASQSYRQGWDEIFGKPDKSLN
jgi:hypothetical protein